MADDGWQRCGRFVSQRLPVGLVRVHHGRNRHCGSDENANRVAVKTGYFSKELYGRTSSTLANARNADDNEPQSRYQHGEVEENTYCAKDQLNCPPVHIHPLRLIHLYMTDDLYHIFVSP